jgi:hypothetical protein
MSQSNPKVHPLSRGPKLNYDCIFLIASYLLLSFSFSADGPYHKSSRGHIQGPPYPSSTDRRKNPHESLLALALTCTEFADPAFDVLWKEIRLSKLSRILGVLGGIPLAALVSLFFCRCVLADVDPGGCYEYCESQVVLFWTRRLRFAVGLQ